MDQLVNNRSAKPARERQNGIDRAIEILDALLRTHRPTSVGDLAKQIGAPRSTLYSITSRLIEAGILEQVGDEGTVYFGQTAHLYGRAYADANPLHRRCREALDRLAMQTAATAQLCALRGNKYVVVDTRDGSGVFRITTDIGVEVPIPWTASGRLLLDHMSAAEIIDFIPEDDFQLPDGRLVEANDFVADIARARAEGSCMTNGLSDPFTCCLAAPIRDRRGLAVATLCFIVPIDSAPERKRELLSRLVESAQELSDRPVSSR
jgi:DNA-binding IclR family transcriptional regulator